MLPNPELREVSIQDYLKIIQKRLSLIIALLVIIPTSAAIYVFTAKPVYRATASVLIEKTTPKVGRFQTSGEDWYIRDYQYYQTQYKILASRALAERVVNDLKLSSDRDFSKSKDLIGVLQGMIKIDPVRNSQIVLINVDDTNALRAARIANSLSSAYIKQDIENRNRASKEAVAWLESQLGDIKKRVQQAEEALNKYIQENKIVAVPDIEKRTETLLESLKKDKSRLETEIAEASKRYRSKHPKMIALSAQLAETNAKIDSETTRFLDLNQKMVQYNLLKKDVESNQQLYTSMLTQAKETGVSEKIEASSISVVDFAKPPDAPYKPKKIQILLISVVLAIFSGIGLVFFVEYLDSSIRTAEDVSNYLNLPFLGYLPSVLKEAKTDSERALISFQKPQSTITESYRSVRTSILFAYPEDKPLKTILVTSSIPGEGKTFAACNLAIVFAQMNERVLLIDIDMRRPKVYKSFHADQKNGMSDFLAGTIDLEKIIKPTEIRNLSLITSGTIPPNPSELLSSAKIRTFFEQIKTRYDRIIVDSPPVLNVADTSILANIADGIILVIKGASTRLEGVNRAKDKILQSKGRIIGAIVNNIMPEKEDRYYYYHYYYSEESGRKQKSTT